MLLHGVPFHSLQTDIWISNAPSESTSRIRLPTPSKALWTDNAFRADNGGLSFFSVNCIYFLVVELRIIAILYLCGSQLIAVWIHGGQQVDAGGVDEGLNSLVPQDVL